MSYFNGRLEEVAYDWFGQDDTGAVWYFGEDVADYNDDGVIFTHEGTWLVERDGGLAMIMPAAPKLGNAFRAEDAAPAAFEEITIKTVGETRVGPSGQVVDVMVASELKKDGELEEKVFAPGYGEFSTGKIATGIEPLALSVPTDALATPPPAELTTLATSTAQIFEAAAAGQWPAAAAAMTGITTAASALSAGAVPPLLKAELTARVASLGNAVRASNVGVARQEAIAVARVTFDFRLRHRPPTEIDRQRFDVWLAQVVLDAASGTAGNLRGDASTLELIWVRIAHTFDVAATAEVKRLLVDLRKGADAGNAAQTAAAAGQLRAIFAASGWR